MKLWKGNRVDAEYKLSNKEVAEKFLSSKFYNLEGHVERQLLDFISDKEGLDSTWEWDKKKGSIKGSPDMLEILDIIDEATA